MALEALTQIQSIGISSNITLSGITTISNLSSSNAIVSGVSTFTNGPVLIGSGTSTGTLSQPLQVIGGGYISGNLGIGTTRPQYKLDILGDINFTGTFYQNSSAFVASRWTAGSGNDIYRLNGNVGIGTTNPAAKLDVNGTIQCGNLSANGTVTASSDIKLKTNIKTIPNALDKVLNLRGVEYDRIDIDAHQIGVIAQEIEKVIPEVVIDNGGTKSVAYGNITAVLIEAIKELKAEVETLKDIIRNN